MWWPNNGCVPSPDFVFCLKQRDLIDEFSHLSPFRSNLNLKYFAMVAEI